MEQSKLESRTNTDQIGSRYADIGRRITSWTSNLLATAVVIVIALVVGRQLVSCWLPNKSGMRDSDFDLAEAWPVLDACSLEFGAAPFQLVREQTTGDETKVISILQDRCRDALERSVIPAAAIGPEEKKMIEYSVNWVPVEQRAGKWRIFRPEQFDIDNDATEAELGLQLPMVLGIRDDCPVLDQSSEPGLSSRLVVWGIALPGEDKTWTTLVGQSAGIDSSSQMHQNWLPEFSRRTLAISDKKGGLLIGFSGGNTSDTIEFYDGLAQKNNWTISTPWQQSNHQWVARFTPNSDSSIAGIQVQLHLNHNEQTRGILLVQSK